MPTRSQVCAWIAAVGLLSPRTAAAQDRTEREVVDLVVRDGPQARAIRAEAEVTRREQLARLAWPNPQVTYSRESAGFTEFLQGSQALPIFGVRAALSRAGVAATAAADAERDARLWLLRSDAATTVAHLIAAQRRLAATQALGRDVERVVETLRIREREGEGSRFDRLRAEHELHETRQQATSLAADVATARSALDGLLPTGVTAGLIASTVDPGQSSSPLELLLSRASTTRAELRALQQSATRAEQEAQAARRARWPAPTVFGGLKRADDAAARETGALFGISASIPLFDNGRLEAARWTAEHTRLDAERSATEQRIRAEITGAAEILSLRQAALTGEQPNAADDLAQIAGVAYREGEIGILEWLDAVRTTSRARLRQIDAALDARLAQIALERAVGETLWP
jgi:outer membrane protein TolC